MKIAICEDSPLQQEQLRACINAWAHRQAVSPHVHCYASANSFFFNCEEDGPFDLLFLDIDLSGTNPALEQHLSSNEDGLRIAERIREQDPQVLIVFVTNNTNHVFKGYKVQAFDFLPKPVQPYDVERILTHTNRQLSNTAEQSFLVDTSLGVKRVMLADIYYFEAQRHFVELHGTQGTETFRARFQDIISELSPRDFLSPHRSFLVNMAHIQRLSKSAITMTDGRELPIARNKQNEIASAWLNYFGGGPTTKGQATKGLATNQGKQQ